MYKSLKTLIYIFLVTSILYSQRENEVFKYLDPLKVDMNQIHLQQIDDLIKDRAYSILYARKFDEELENTLRSMRAEAFV